MAVSTRTNRTLSSISMSRALPVCPRVQCAMWMVRLIRCIIRHRAGLLTAIPVFQFTCGVVHLPSLSARISWLGCENCGIRARHHFVARPARIVTLNLLHVAQEISAARLGPPIPESVCPPPCCGGGGEGQVRGGRMARDMFL